MKSIQSQFVAAARLVNEWRDTLFYGVLGVMTVSAVLQGDAVTLALPPMLAFLREHIRALAWLSADHPPFNKDKVIVEGNRLIPMNTKRNAGAALLTNFLLFAPLLASIINSAINYKGSAVYHYSFNQVLANLINSPEFHKLQILFPTGLLGAYALMRFDGGRLRDLPKLYFDDQTGMWDWPRRKRGGGGTTQTEKFINSMKELGRGLAGWAPVPSPGAARVPVLSREFMIG